MCVFVDDAAYVWRGRHWCHLLADNIIELHSFADLLGLRRVWFQGNTAFPHYDLTESMRYRALRMGAISCDRRAILEKALRLRAEYRNDPSAVALLKWIHSN